MRGDYRSLVASAVSSTDPCGMLAGTYTRGTVDTQVKVKAYSGLILGLRPVNERRRFKVTPSLVGWALTENHSWYYTAEARYNTPTKHTLQIDGSVEDCSNSGELAIGLLQSCNIGSHRKKYIKTTGRPWYWMCHMIDDNYFRVYRELYMSWSK